MWASKGRSGYGDSTIGGDYDSWDGISPNGRQYKNEVTMETRDLSGADYWHLRKQNRPTEEIPASLHMLSPNRANISAYADKEFVKKVSKTPLKNKVIPQLTRYNNLTEQMKEIVAQYNAKEIDIKEYSMLMDITVAKRDRAKILLDKAMLLKPVRDDDAESAKASVKPSHTSTSISSHMKQKACQVWTEARMFLVGSVAACAGLLWLAN